MPNLHHHMSRKIIFLSVIFLGLAVLALISNFYLLEKIQKSSPTELPPSLSVKPSAKPTKLHTYSNENITFTYPDIYSLDLASESAITWKAQLDNGNILPGAISLKEQLVPFNAPQNTDNVPGFSIDDQQGRIINGIDIFEYTVHCGYRCNYREDQFSLNNRYYQLRFNVSIPGFSDLAEQIITSLKKKLPTPSASTEPVMCTMEAKQCPDGSWVGRTGPRCEFTACPSQ